MMYTSVVGMRTAAITNRLFLHQRHNGTFRVVTTFESMTSKVKRRRCIMSTTICSQQRCFSDIAAGAGTTSGTGTGTKTPLDDSLVSNYKSIPTALEVARVGGVWALTSAKRDKLGELKAALTEGQETLDDVATEEELLDLYFADGLNLIAKVTDTASDTKNTEFYQIHDNGTILNEFSTWLDNQLDPSLPDTVSKSVLESKLEVASAKIDNLLERLPTDQCLVSVRDYLDPAVVDREDKQNNISSNLDSNDTFNMDTTSFQDAVSHFRLLLAKSAINQVLKSWKTLTTVSDADLDRAAVEGIALKSDLDTLSLSKVFAFVQKNISGNCSDRLTAAWNLLDRDGDGSLDQEEMNEVVHLCVRIEQEASQALFKEALDIFPVRAPLSAIGSDDQPSAPQGWRQRRIEKIAKKKLIQMFQQSCKKHFEVEVEINHRLRCIYSWANKADQDNKMKSVLVDDHGWSGRKRYVELSPKISESEFREVQEIHFTHLNRIGSETITSFRENLWVLQGKGRERKELLRNSALFLSAVSLIDFVILML